MTAALPAAPAAPVALLLDAHPGPLSRPSAKGKGKEESSYPQDAQEESPSLQQRTYWRRAKWSPDGSHVLLQGEQHTLETKRLLPIQASFEADTEMGEGARRTCRLEAGSLPMYRAPAPLLDATWYPYARAPTDGRTEGKEDEQASASPASGGGATARRQDQDEAAAQQWAKKQSWCFLSSVRNVPVRLVDADSGTSRSSYGVMDHVERFVAPTAMAFSPYGDRFYAGHDSYLTIHDLSHPGLNTHDATLALAGPANNISTHRSRPQPWRTQPAANLRKEGEDGNGGQVVATTKATTVSRRAKLRMKRALRRQLAAVQQRGIVSSLAVALDPGFHSDPTHLDLGADGDGRTPDLVCVGTFAGNVGLYAMGRGRSAGECCVAGWKETNGQGISQLAFHPTAPNLLFVRSRRSNAIKVYDIRLLCGCLAVDFQAPRAQASYDGRTSGTLVAVLMPSVGVRGGKKKETGNGQPGKNGKGTQQRLFFDVHPSGRWLCAGDAGGIVRIWNIDVSAPSFSANPLSMDAGEAAAKGGEQDPQHAGIKTTEGKRTLRSLLDEFEARLVGGGEEDAQNAQIKAIRLEPTMHWQAHPDPVACAAFHPSLPLLLTLGGTRRTDDEADSEPGRDDSDESNSGSSGSSDSESDADPNSDAEVDGASDGDVDAGATSLKSGKHGEALKLWHVPLMDVSSSTS
ncbi:hypothetical protein OC834_004248 [Tilletia horrida]|nr:hypothetical protein OC834_004248 [Tilletia horrida]